jgi:hypothetical protein
MNILMLLYNNMADRVKYKLATISRNMVDVFQKQSDVQVTIFLVAVIIILIFVMSLYVYKKRRLNEKNCNDLDKIYDAFPLISSMNPREEKNTYLLRDYYIKTAYNSCCGGEFKNDFVNVCALKKCIQQGARCLDFQIYSVNNEPVISTSSVDDFFIKETYNSVSFSDAMNVISNNAFSGSTCPNSQDPLLLHFRINSTNKDIYNKMSDVLQAELSERVLGKEYSYEFEGYNLGAVPINNFMGKVIIIIDRSNDLFEDTELKEYCNIASNSMFMRGLRNYDIQYNPNIDDLTYYNKKNMSIVMPDVGAYDDNYAAGLAMSYGCQMVGMNFQNFDANMEFYDILFDEAGSAFVLKPQNLRYIPETIKNPPPQNPELSYANRKVESDYYSFNI